MRVGLLSLNRSILSPIIAFPALWLLAAGAALIPVLNQQSNWRPMMVAVVVSVPIAFIAGGLIGQAITLAVASPDRPRVASPPGDRASRVLILGLMAIGLAEMIHQFVRIGGIPLLSGSTDELRFSIGGPSIILTNLLTVAALIAFVKPKRLFAREARFELIAGLISVGSFALLAGRGSVVLPIVVAVFSRWLLWGRPSFYLIGASVVFVLIALSLGFFVRLAQDPEATFQGELYWEILPKFPFFLLPLIPLYIAVTTNFIALAGVVGHFPTIEPFAGGKYNLIGLDLFFPGAESIADLSAGLTPPWVTSTIAGALWADGGFAAVVIGVAVAGGLSAAAFAASRRIRSLRWSLVAGYLLFHSLFGVYTNLWTQQVDWLMVTPLLYILGSYVEKGLPWQRAERLMQKSS